MSWKSFHKGRCLLALIVSVVLPSCSPAPHVVERELEAMGTTLVVAVPTEDARHLGRACQQTKGTITRLEHLISLYDPESEVSAINRVGGMVRLPVASETHRLIRMAIDISEKTDGAFDITVGPLGFLWGFHGKTGLKEAPSDKVIQLAKRGMGSEHIRIDDRTVQLTSPYTRIDLGGLLKGYAVDLSIIHLHREGVKNACVTLGSQTRCIGNPRPEMEWTIDIPHPRDESQLLGSLELTNGIAAATSLLYNDTVVVGEEVYGHVVDPRTGWPAQGTLLATVCDPTATEADAMATAFLILGVERGWEVLEELPNVEAIFVPDRQPLEIWVTEGLVRRFRAKPELQSAIHILNRD